jgi:hypothetical protein
MDGFDPSGRIQMVQVTAEVGCVVVVERSGAQVPMVPLFA